MLNLIIGAFFISTLISFVSTLLISLWYRKRGLLDAPDINPHAKVVHIKAVPRGGGVPIFLSLLITGALFLTIDKHFVGILLGGLVLTIVGVLDDIYDIHPYIRIFTGILAALFVIGAGIGIAYITNPLGASGSVINLSQPQLAFQVFGSTHTIWILADIFALIWIVWMMNMVNWSKGVDGQMPGFVSIAAIFIGLLSLQFAGDVTQWQVTLLAAIVSGAYFGFLFWNAYPQKIMPGYGGGSLAGYLLAILSILSGAKVATLMLVVAIPMIDAVYTIIRRVLRGKSPIWGDRGHLHHRLLDMGWSKKKIAYFYWGTTIMLGVLGLQLNSSQKAFSFIALALILGATLVWLKLVSYVKTSETI